MKLKRLKLKVSAIKASAGLPGFVTTSAPVMSRSGAIVNYTAGVYSPVPTGVLTTFYIDDVAQAPGSITFPYTLTAGSRMRATELPSSVGYSGVLVASNEVYYPLPTDIADGAWTYGEFDPANDAILSTNTRKTFISTAIAPQGGKEWRAYRGTNPPGDLGALAAMTFNSPNYEFTSGGQNGRGVTVTCRIAETDIGGANPRWASSALTYTASNVPAAPVVSVAQGAGLYDVAVTLITAADGRGRGVTGYEIQIGTGAAWTTLAGGTATGLRTINTGSAADVAISVRAVNANVSGGVFGVATTPATVTPGVASTPMTVTSTTSFVSDGVTLTADRSVDFGHTGGYPWIINTGGFEITANAPASVVINGYMANGIMLNPFGGMTPASGNVLSQGFDAMCAAPLGSKAAAPYDAALNVAPTATGTNLVIPPGWTGVISCAVRRAGAVGGSYDVIEKYVHFNVWTSIPNEESIPLSPSDPTKTIYGRFDQLNYNVLRSLAPYAGMPDAATCLAQHPKNTPRMGWHGDVGRRMHVFVGLQGYSGVTGEQFADGTLFLHSNATNAQKKAIFERKVVSGIHQFGVYNAGGRGIAGAGQGFDQVEDVFLAGFALNNPAMIAAAQDMKSNITTQYRFIKTADVGYPASFPVADSQGGRFKQTYFAEQLDWPEWQPSDNQVVARYRPTCAPAFIPNLMGVALLQNGPGGITGDVAVRNGGAYTSANDAAASTMYMDRAIRQTPFNFSSYSLAARNRAMYLAWRASVPAAQWHGTPEMIDQSWTNDVGAAAPARVTPLSGGFAYNFADFDYSGDAITRFDLGYSLDGVGFTEINSTTASGTVTGLMSGATYYVRPRIWNSYGAGPWGPIYPVESPTSSYVGGIYKLDRNKVTTTGTPANAAPVNAGGAGLPQLFVKPYPGWLGPYYVPAAGYGGTPLEYFASVGVWSGFPAPTFTYQYKLGGVDISGETLFNYLFSGANSGQTLTCDVTATNTSGSATATTPGVVIPVATGTRAFYVPTGTAGTLPKKMTQRWASAVTLTRESFSSRNIMRIGIASPAANRFWSFDDLMPIGDLSDVPEGEVYLTCRAATNVSGAVAGIGVCITGDETTGSGYIMEVTFSSTVIGFNVVRTVAGARTTNSLGTTTPAATGISATTETAIRYQWQTVGATRVFKIKAWPLLIVGGDFDGDPTPEPAAWFGTYTDSSPLASGRVGMAARTNSVARDFFGFGIGVGNGVSAPISAAL